MADVFKRTELNFGGAFAADKGLITPNKGLTGVMMQNLSLNYSQAVTRIYEIGMAGKTPSMYYIGGRSQGQMQAAHVIGPRIAMKAYYDAFSDVCEAATNDINIKLTKVDCGSSGGSRSIGYKAKFCVLVSIGVTVSAQDMVINENSQLMFSNLEYEEA
jgi:hypothetical protein